MIAQVLKDVRRQKAEQERLMRILTNTKQEHNEQLRKLEDEVETHIEKVKSEVSLTLKNLHPYKMTHK